MLILLGQQYVANMNIYPRNRVIVMACRLSSGGVLLGPAEEATSCRGGNQQKWLQTTPVCANVPYHTCAIPHNTLPNIEHTLPYHTCSWFYQGIHICHATHYHTNQQKYLQTTPIQHQARLRSLYIIKGFRNYQPIVTTISHDTLAYLEFTAIILVQYTQSKHRESDFP